MGVFPYIWTSVCVCVSVKGACVHDSLRYTWINLWRSFFFFFLKYKHTHLVWCSLLSRRRRRCWRDTRTHSFYRLYIQSILTKLDINEKKEEIYDKTRDESKFNKLSFLVHRQTVNKSMSHSKRGKNGQTTPLMMMLFSISICFVFILFLMNE